MRSHNQNLINIVVSILGLLVGIDNLFIWGINPELHSRLILGCSCVLLATAWLIRNIIVMKNLKVQNRMEEL